MSVENTIKRVLEELRNSGAKRATVEEGAYLIIHQEAGGNAIRLESDDAAVALGTTAAVDALCEVVNIEEEDVLTYSGIHIPDDVLGLLETLVEIDEA